MWMKAHSFNAAHHRWKCIVLMCHIVYKSTLYFILIQIYTVFSYLLANFVIPMALPFFCLFFYSSFQIFILHVIGWDIWLMIIFTDSESFFYFLWSSKLLWKMTFSFVFCRYYSHIVVNKFILCLFTSSTLKEWYWKESV